MRTEATTFHAIRSARSSTFNWQFVVFWLVYFGLIASIVYALI